MRIHGNCKLTDVQVKEIFIRGLRGEKQCDLAREFGITRPHVFAIINRQATEWNAGGTNADGVTISATFLFDAMPNASLFNK